MIAQCSTQRQFPIYSFFIHKMSSLLYSQFFLGQRRLMIFAESYWFLVLIKHCPTISWIRAINLIFINEDHAGCSSCVIGKCFWLKCFVQLHHSVYESLLVITCLELILFAENSLEVIFGIFGHFGATMAVEYSEQHAIVVWICHLYSLTNMGVFHWAPPSLHSASTPVEILIGSRFWILVFDGFIQKASHFAGAS